MAKLTKETFIESLKEMNLLEINELVEAMKEEFGVDPSAVAVAAAPAAPAAGAAGTDAPSEVAINLVSFGANKINVIKAVKEITGLGLKEAKDLVEKGGAIKENVPVAEAEKIKAQLEEAGAEIELK